jgi:hypothetical protein
MVAPSWRNLFGFMPLSWRGEAPWRNAALTDMALNKETAKKLSPSSHRQAVVVGSRKLIISLNGGSEYYDLARDPLEKTTSAFSEAKRASLAQALANLGPPVGQSPAVAEVTPVDEEHKRRLRALGYAE